MNKHNLKTLAISLDEIKNSFSEEEKKNIEKEKKYYGIAIELKRKREELGLTQEELAQKANIPRTTITKIESGSRNTTLETILTLSQAMGTQVQMKFVP